MVTPLKHIQTRLSKRTDGQFGNCLQTAIACLMLREIEEVPRFEIGFWDKGYKWFDALEAWAKHQGYEVVCDTQVPEKGFTVAAGTSPRGTGHVCIYQKGELWHDVHPSGDGLATVDYWFWFLPAERDMKGFHTECTPDVKGITKTQE